MASPLTVWYAAYGSNLRRARFLTYLQGGQPPDSPEGAVAQSGAEDTSPPRQDAGHLTRNWQLTFRGHSSRWGGGVAYLQPAERPLSSPTRLRLWCITFDQFVDVYLQENGLVPASLSIAQRQAVRRWMTLAMASAEDRPAVPDTVDDLPAALSRGSYRRVIGLGLREGSPILSFTSPLNHAAATLPSSAYATTIAVGLRETYADWPALEVQNYLQAMAHLPPAQAAAVTARAIEIQRCAEVGGR